VHVHPQAIVESQTVGAETKIWAYAHVLPGAVVGKCCNIGDHCFVESGAVIADNVTLKNHVCVWEGVTLEDDVFVGPLATFTNDMVPRSARSPIARERYVRKENWLVRTVVERGASIGANATILPGIRIGRYSFVAAGAVVTRDVAPFTVVRGVPARPAGYVCRCGAQRGAAARPACEHCDAQRRPRDERESEVNRSVSQRD